MSIAQLHKIQLVVSDFYYIIESYVDNLILVVNEDLHLVQKDKSVLANRDLDFLFNLTADPYKAREIMMKMKSVLNKWNEVGVLRTESKEFYFDLMCDAMSYNFKNDTAALIYVDRVILKISNLIINNDTYPPK